MKRLLLALLLIASVAYADFKDVNLITISEYQQCLDRSGDFSTDQLATISQCFEDVFTTQDTLPPEPEPEPGDCLSGFHGERWLGHDACVDEPDKFRNESNGVSVMGTNANAYWPMSPPGGQTRGSTSVEVFYRTAQIPQDTGGGHLFTAESSERPYDPNHPKAWFRPDIVSQQSTWRIHTYNLDGNGNRWFLRNGQPDVVVDLWNTGITNPGVGRWIKLKLEWDRRASDRMWMRFTCDGQSRERTVTIHPDSKNPRGVGFGNQDGLGQFGGTPEIAFRNFTWSN
jgi:hypothetical protein